MREDDNVCNEEWVSNAVFDANVKVTQIFPLPWIGNTLIIHGLDHQVLLCNPTYRNIKYIVI